MMTTNEKHDKVMSATGHVLVTGGPGSGKTTISILKAAAVVESHLQPEQRVLFLSFARATVSRIIEAIEREHELSPRQKSRIHVETYHAFFWRILKTHGYLIGLPRRLSILLPQNEAVALSAIRNEYKADRQLNHAAKKEKKSRENAERERLASEEGRVCFDLFALYTGQLLHRSRRIRKLLALMYPYIVLDEFQDTNGDQWHVVKALAENSIICALGDPEQRIYDWIGADPERLNHFREECEPEEIDLGDDNHRSKGTDIRMFGDHALRGEFRRKSYEGVSVVQFECNSNQAYATVCAATLQGRKRLLKTKRRDWSLAVLVPTKRMTRQVSDVFRSPPANLPAIRHSAAVEMEGAILAAELVGILLQPAVDENLRTVFIQMLCNFYRGKGGETPSKTALDEAARIERAFDDFNRRVAAGRSILGNSILVSTFEVYEQTRVLCHTGNPEKDWLAVRKVLDEGKCKRLREVAEELRNVRLLDRGAQLRQNLSQNWRDHGAYVDALEIVRQTFVQEHFSMTRRPEMGVVVMNMHKAKGKQFDEVIIFEGWPRYVGNQIVSNPGRIVRGNIETNLDDQTRQNFRVSVTRGKKRVIILTPKYDPCILLLGPRGS